MAEIVQLVENGVKKFLKTHAKAVDGLYPVGSIYLSVNAENPSELFGGTWEQFAKGQTLVGTDESDPDFDTAEKTGGEKRHTNTIEETPKMKFSFSGTTGGANVVAGVNNGDVKLQGASSGWGFKSATHTHAFSGQTNELGGGQSHNNMQPYITVYMWKRTA